VNLNTNDVNMNALAARIWLVNLPRPVVSKEPVDGKFYKL
jgi:hypothetical protein